MGTDTIYDIAVIGGGINGVGVAADAAGRGLKVCLLEQGDLGGATSSASSKLIHGGLRYLEHYEFGMVRDALQERERLLKVAGHIISPLRFVLPHVDGMRRRWLLRAGLFLYDHLATGRTLPTSGALRFATDPSGGPLRPELTRGFAYWDCQVDDARLVVLNARSAAQNGAAIRPRTRVTSFEPCHEAPGVWRIATSSQRHGERSFKARAIVNAAGPWVDDVAARERREGPNRSPDQNMVAKRQLRLVKGSHIVVARTPGMRDAYLLQNFDGRVVFALPFEDAFTLIGTTDVAFEGDPAAVTVSAKERAYLVKVYNRYFVRRLGESDIVHEFAGVRPLHDDGEQDPAKITRDYCLDVRAAGRTPLLMTVLGGKLTTYRRVAEEALNRLAPAFPNMGPAWTANQPLPGGAFEGSFGAFQRQLKAHYPDLDRTLLQGFAGRYGTLALDLLAEVQTMSDLGAELAPGLYEREVCYLRDAEWAEMADDVLWRRTKIGLHVPGADRARVEAKIAACLEE